MTEKKLNDQPMAQPTYTSGGDLQAVAYPSGIGNAGNGTSLTVNYSDALQPTGVTWTLAGSTKVTDAVTLSQSGKIIDEVFNDVHPGTGNTYSYDGASRLVTANVPGHALTYNYTDTADTSCPANMLSKAGRNSDIVWKEDNGQRTAYCYNDMDQLTSTNDPAVGTPDYDATGNATSLDSGSATMTLGYDVSERHNETSYDDTAEILLRDATGRIVQREIKDSKGGDTTYRYSFAGDGDAPAFTLDADNAVLETQIGLPGGVLVTKRTDATLWSYPNMHGDIIVTADTTGTQQGAVLSYDPYGNITGTYPDNGEGDLSYAWLGKAQRGTDHKFPLALVEMGARPYLPQVGRFLQADPVDGGSDNLYDYVGGDPINRFDLSGKSWFTRLFAAILVMIAAILPIPPIIRAATRAVQVVTNGERRAKERRAGARAETAGRHARKASRSHPRYELARTSSYGAIYSSSEGHASLFFGRSVTYRPMQEYYSGHTEINREIAWQIAGGVLGTFGSAQIIPECPPRRRPNAGVKGVLLGQGCLAPNSSYGGTGAW